MTVIPVVVSVIIPVVISVVSTSALPITAATTLLSLSVAILRSVAKTNILIAALETKRSYNELENIFINTVNGI